MHEEGQDFRDANTPCDCSSDNSRIYVFITELGSMIHAGKSLKWIITFTHCYWVMQNILNVGEGQLKKGKEKNLLYLLCLELYFCCPSACMWHGSNNLTNFNQGQYTVYFTYNKFGWATLLLCILRITFLEV